MNEWAPGFLSNRSQLVNVPVQEHCCFRTVWSKLVWKPAYYSATAGNNWDRACFSLSSISKLLLGVQFSCCSCFLSTSVWRDTKASAISALTPVLLLQLTSALQTGVARPLRLPKMRCQGWWRCGRCMLHQSRWKVHVLPVAFIWPCRQQFS